MPKKIKKIIIAVYVIVILAAIVGYGIYSSRMIYNPEGASGNTAGNLNNNGMFCESDGKIYFANPYDQNKLYVMDSDCSNIHQLNSDHVCSLNAYGPYIYYVKNNYTPESALAVFRGQLLGVIRCNLKGQNTKTLYDSVAGVINLYGNELYYQHYSDDDALSFYKVNIDGTDNTRISDNGYYPSSIYEDVLYYVNTVDNHNIYAYNIKTKQTTLYLEANAYMVDMQGDFIYYIDLGANYSLVRVNTYTKDKEVLVDGREGKCISYNIYENSLFYHVEGDTPALYRMNLDGSDNTFIKSGNITNISCTSQYTFFQMYGTTSLYRVPTAGAANVDLITIE